ncbi:hypothetical protein E8D34_12560 [Nocardioides sp. GY 10113]|uniref:PKD domain-containing protein n=1 Tax=Nocardioides sp. GY 10113 TaxID=2569761 RepID=UPI0010A930FE|nr:PKD domain-containing protein [Nocardioides sp. GY 10113]TIC85926.1 hypothetical protein E8D34_12560 [Nocardioides sp. GY 10113]
MVFWTTDPATGETISDGTYCPTDTTVEDAPAELTPGLVLEAFRRLPLPEARLIIEPPDGRTLVNLPTNFYSPDQTLDRTVTLLGRRVDLRIRVATYHWDFGDGTTRETTSPGAPYPALTLTHTYLRAARYRPRLDATYAADYRVDDGPWQPVDGTVTIAGTPTALRALEATPTLVDYR